MQIKLFFHTVQPLGEQYRIPVSQGIPPQFKAEFGTALFHFIQAFKQAVKPVCTGVRALQLFGMQGGVFDQCIQQGAS